MLIEDRDRLAEQIFTKCRELMLNKGADYAGAGDCLNNFKVVAQRLGLMPFQIWAVCFNKHVEAINNSIKCNPEQPKRKAETIDGSIIDSINYLVILQALLQEIDNETSEVIREKVLTKKEIPYYRVERFDKCGNAITPETAIELGLFILIK